jgi:AraC-like DNA-binding protein
MKQRKGVISRTRAKTFESLLALKLIHDYCLSPVEADTLTRDIKEHIELQHEDVLKEGEILFTAVLVDEPAGKPLKDCKTKQIKLSVYPPELIDLFFKDIKTFHKIMVQRLSWQAVKQGCSLTQEDLARLLHCSPSTIRRIIREYREEKIFIPTRGNYCDIGPGVSHKTEAVKKYLKGYTVSEIALAMGHNRNSIERYLDGFCMVISGHVNENYSALRLSRSLRMSEKLVAEYISLYHQFKDDPDCQYRLKHLLLRMSELMERSKKNNRRKP